MEEKTTSRLGDFFARVKSMLKLDFYRLFHTPALYIMLGVAAMIPAMLATMTGGEQGGADIQNVWQLVESLGGSAVAEDPLNFAGFANINMVFIFAGLLMSIFVAHDYSSGFVKNIFTVHAKKADYVISKTITGTVGGIGMLCTYVLGAVISGAITQKSFSVEVGGLIACLCSKAFLMFAFCAFFLAVSVFFRSKLWLTIIFTFLLGMMLYPAASVATLASTLVTCVITLLAGIALAIGIGAVSTVILNKRDLA